MRDDFQLVTSFFSGIEVNAHTFILSGMHVVGWRNVGIIWIAYKKNSGKLQKQSISQYFSYCYFHIHFHIFQWVYHVEVGPTKTNVSRVNQMTECFLKFHFYFCTSQLNYSSLFSIAFFLIQHHTVYILYESSRECTSNESCKDSPRAVYGPVSAYNCVWLQMNEVARIKFQMDKT